MEHHHRHRALELLLRLLHAGLLHAVLEPGTLAGLKPASFRAGETVCTADVPTSASPILPSAAALLAHGAGGHKDHSHILDLSALLRGLGLTVVRFNFPYKDRGKGPPDPMPVLMATVSAVAEAARKALSPGTLILAGHSMGGRAASMAVAEGVSADGLLLFSYPWHPPGKVEKPRTAHLGRIRLPVLGFTGTRDTFCDRNAMSEALESLPSRWSQVWIEGADHGLEVLKKSGRTREDVMAGMSADIAKWLKGLPG